MAQLGYNIWYFKITHKIPTINPKNFHDFTYIIPKDTINMSSKMSFFDRPKSQNPNLVQLL